MENKTQVWGWKHYVHYVWAGNIMYAEIDRMFKMYSFQPSQSGLFWYGMFSSLHVLLGVVKTLMTVFISMFCVLDGFIQSLWNTKLYLKGVCCMFVYCGKTIKNGC